jgi:hypothetical protein
MRTASVILALSWLLPSTLIAQGSAGRAPATSRVTTLIGVGNSFGGLGVMADYKAFGKGPVSLMLAVGSTQAAVFDARGLPNPYTDESVAKVAGAVGLRANMSQGRHQPFLELAALPVAADIVEVSVARQRHQLLYGLGLQLGYRGWLGDGITLNVMGGPGYALTKDVVASRWKLLLGGGIGYAWPRR